MTLFFIYIIGAIGAAIAAHHLFEKDPKVPKGQWFPSDAPLWFLVLFVSILWPVILAASLIHFCLTREG